MSGMPGMPAQAMKTTADVTTTYGKVEEGTAELVSVTSNMKMEGPGLENLPPDLFPKETRTTGKIDAQGMVTTKLDPAAAGADPTGGLAQALIGDKPVPQGVQLPAKPVSPGDKWKTPMPLYEELGMTGDIENTYVGETVFGGKPAYRITFEAHFKPGNNPAAAQANPLAGMGSMTMDITGEAIIDKADCSILSVTSNTVSTTSMSMRGQNMNMSQKIQTTQKRVN
jgi:hypothetical protein